MEVKRTERGWPGHYCCANSCLFRRNTLLECGEVKIVVSTIGLRQSSEQERFEKMKFEMVGLDRYYETMAFHSNATDKRYHDADVTRQVSFDSPWAIGEVDADDRANNMHEAVVEEITESLREGKLGQAEPLV